jgi:hypothetical protein
LKHATIDKADTPDQAGSKQVRRRTRVAQAGRGSSMEKWLCWGALGIAGLLCLLFLFDLATGLLFGSGTVVKVLDGVAAAGSGLVAYLAWDTLREWK